MIRKELSELEGTRTRWRGTVQKFGTVRQQTTPTVALTNLTAVRLGGICLDHAWLVGEFCNTLEVGDVIYFDADVYSYRQGNTRWAWEPEKLPTKWGLRNPANFLKARPVL